MRTFEHPNTHNNWHCPICKKDDDKPVVLIGITGTQDDNIMEAEQFHLECIDLLYYKDADIIAMNFRKKRD